MGCAGEMKASGERTENQNVVYEMSKRKEEQFGQVCKLRKTI